MSKSEMPLTAERPWLLRPTWALLLPNGE